MTTTYTWTDANGATTVLNEANGYLVSRGPIGLDAPAPNNVIEDYNSFDGGTLISRRRPVRQVVLPIMVRHATRVQTRIAALASLLQGPGQLEVSDGTNTRHLRNVIYEAGLGGDLSQPSTRLWRRIVVSLLALDPWWYGPAESQALSTAAATAFDAAISFDAAIPFDGGAATSVTVAGDAETYPVITVVGPLTTLTVGTGDLQWSLAVSMFSTDVLVVDHRPGSRGPRLNGGAIDWTLLIESSRLWPIGPGATSVVASATGTTGATSVSMAWEPRFLTP